MMHSFLVDVFALVRIISEFISQAVLNLGLAIFGERNRKLTYRYCGSAVCLKDRSWKHEVRRRKTRLRSPKCEKLENVQPLLL